MKIDRPPRVGQAEGNPDAPHDASEERPDARDGKRDDAEPIRLRYIRSTRAAHRAAEPVELDRHACNFGGLALLCSILVSDAEPLRRARCALVLQDMHELVREQLPAAGRPRPVLVPAEEEFASRRESACIESPTRFIGFLPGVHAHGSEVDAEEGLEARADVVVERTAAAPHLVDRFLDGGGHLGPIGRVIRR